MLVDKPNNNNTLYREEIKMMSRREIESLLGEKISDEAWEYNKKVLAECEEQMWNEDHPMDD